MIDSNVIAKICLSLPSSTQEYKEEWDAYRFMVADKMYALVGEDSEKQPILTLKCDPIFSEELRDQYKEIKPGYYMNKKHWISIYYSSSIPLELTEKLINHSYQLVLKSLPKYIQKEIQQ
ncbi:MmcQ/YjbR family DNA-binding protein [Gracilibacillus xinjiangensis]|uniref:MmcQ/YjbR family DNA-binding protein n=1 Tax=Gracilibacillus xinjiangensis TaxID=1193282 RepID=A0ABV8WWF4_9BACI